VIPDLPTGTVTFLFTDIEGSTRLLRELGDSYRAVQDDHMRLMREAIAQGGGTEIRTEGDSFFVVFPSATEAVRAVVTAQQSLAEHTWSHGEPLRVRMGLHTGEGRLGGDDYLGMDVNRAARIAAAAHGGQVLLSEATRALVAETLPDGVSLLSLGEHRLKDFDDPQPIHQLLIDGLAANFPPIRSLEIPTNLPPQLTSFVGREQELAEIESLLDSSRLVTLTGVGGSGKTRLALRAGFDLLGRFPDGVFFVDLSSITESALVPSVIAGTLRSGERGSRPVMEALQIELRQLAALLILDNFEQVIEASDVVGKLLSSAALVRFLVTSRGPLRIRGEQEYPVAPLDLPDQRHLPAVSELPSYAAIALFVERATAIDPQFQLTEENAPAVVEICRRLDGLPLAIELATSRLRLMSPAAMLERLDRALPLLAGGSRDLPARQRTLRGAIGWSHDLLSPEMAVLFRRVCVFAGGFTLDAAEAVCRPEADLGLDAMEAMEDLLGTALVRRTPTMMGDVRFDTLQTVREFGLERLADDEGALEVRRRHALHFLDLAERFALESRGPDLPRFMGLLHVEHDNVRAALTWALENDEGDVALRLSSSVWRFWHLHGDLSAGRRWLSQALALPSASSRTRERAQALIALGSLSYWQRDRDACADAYTEALDIFTELDDPAGIAYGTFNLGFVRLIEGNTTEAVQMLQASRSMFEALGDRRGVADCLFGLSIAARLQGDMPTARATGEEGLRLHEEVEDVFGVVSSLYAAGRAAAEMGDFDVARAYFLRVLGLAQLFGDRTGIALALDNLANEEMGRGDPIRALRLGGASDAIKEGVGGEAPHELVVLTDPRERAAPSLTRDQIDAAWADGRAMSLEDVVAYAREES
jgi:predicted ATPase/class 3 adenylate cyclase